MRSNKTRFTILGMLSIESMSGYEIKREIEQSTKHFWAESDGQIYPALAKLVEEELIKPLAQQQTGKRAKQRYKITALGKTALREWLVKEPDKFVARNELLLQLFFGANVDKNYSIEKLEQAKAKALSQERRYQEIAAGLKDSKSENLPYWLMTLDYGIRLNAAKREWCEAQIKILNKVGS